MSVTGHPHHPRISLRRNLQPTPETRIPSYCFPQMAFYLNIKTPCLALRCPPYFTFYHLTLSHTLSSLHARWSFSLAFVLSSHRPWSGSLAHVVFPSMHVRPALPSLKVQPKANQVPENNQIMAFWSTGQSFPHFLTLSSIHIHILEEWVEKKSKPFFSFFLY